jgi:hypothetical protein
MHHALERQKVVRSNDLGKYSSFSTTTFDAFITG